MFDGVDTSTRLVYLAPGQLAATCDPCTLRTVLGSCVAVTLYDPIVRAGGMNHYLLPGTGPDENPVRYGEGALETLLSRMKRLGATTGNLQAGVFGGARVLADLSNTMHLGERNVEFAFTWLRARKINVVARDILGKQARRLELDVTDGSTRLRLLGGP